MKPNGNYPSPPPSPAGRGELRVTIIAFACIAVAEALAFAAWRAPSFAPWAFAIVACAALVATLVDIRFGVLVAVGELAVGGFGYLFALPLGGVDLSIRMAIFLIVVGVWTAKKILRVFAPAKDRRLPSRAGETGKWIESPYAIPTLALGAAVGWGIVCGIFGKNDPAAIFFDANGFLFFLYAPIFYETLSSRARIREAISVAFTCVLWLAAEVALFAFVFSHGVTSLAAPLYKFIRDTRVGEITPAGGDVFRFFLQSQVYLVPALLVIFAALALLRGAAYPHPNPLPASRTRQGEGIMRDRLIALGSLLTAIFLLTFSRSFWIGMAVALLALAGWLIWKLRVQSKGFLLWIGKLLAILFFAIGILLALVNFPYPLKRSVSPIASLIAERAGSNGDAAAASRWALLPVLWDAVRHDAIFGRGFGATLTYVTQDPRVRASNPTGEYTTFAFEWAWLDLWLKTGIFGVAAYLWVLATLWKRGVAAVRESARFTHTLTLHPLLSKPGSAPEGLEPRREDPSQRPARQGEGSGAVTPLLLGLTLGVLALAVVHIFTPYLNHPLGIGFLVFASCAFASRASKEL